MSLLRLKGGTLYDPANGINGAVRDIWIQNGTVIDPPADPAVRPDTTLDATGLVVMPGGVDIHSHIVGPKVNSARKLCPESQRARPPVHRTPRTRSGVAGAAPSTFATGYLYAGMGYTTAFDAAIPPLGARQAHQEMCDTPAIDRGFLVLLGNNAYALRCMRDGDPARLRAYVAWVLGAAKGYGIKIVNPGGVEAWKDGTLGAEGLDVPLPPYGVTPRRIVASLAQTAEELELPHAVHVHCNHLGLPGNSATTLATMDALEGRRAHLTHVQFHSYGGQPDDQRTFRSEVPRLADYVNGHPNLTVDVGQVLFGDTTCMTADAPLGAYLHRLTGRKWFSADLEREAGCGIVPISYRDRSFVHALQWIVGLEWYLLVRDPWRIAMSTDHPNGASFLAYPEIVQLLMDRSYREEIFSRLPARAQARSSLRELDREYTLSEIAIITRAAPARILGLRQKGHLGPGADGDVTVYTPSPDRRVMFAMPRWVIKGGEIVVLDGEIRGKSLGRTIHVAPAFDDGMIPGIRQWFEESYSIQFANYPVDRSYLGDQPVQVPCERRSS